VFNFSKPNGYQVPHQVEHSQVLRSSHAVFICFNGPQKKKTAIISLYSINWLVCITDMVCVYCAVRNEPVTNVEVIFVFKGWKDEHEVCEGLRITVTYLLHGAESFLRI